MPTRNWGGEALGHTASALGICHRHTTVYGKRLRPFLLAADPDYPVKLEVRFCVQGGISPLLANLFLHYAFDLWMQRTFPACRLNDTPMNAICHCRSEAEALALRHALDRRFPECRLVLHAEKTKIVY